MDPRVAGPAFDELVQVLVLATAVDLGEYSRPPVKTNKKLPVLNLV
jgi:hypothetical protein